MRGGGGRKAFVENESCVRGIGSFPWRALSCGHPIKRNCLAIGNYLIELLNPPPLPPLHFYQGKQGSEIFLSLVAIDRLILMEFFEREE